MAGVRLSLLSHEFEQFGSLHMCAPGKDIGRSGNPLPPGLWVNHATNELSWRYIKLNFAQLVKYVYDYFQSGR